MSFLISVRDQRSAMLSADQTVGLFLEPFKQRFCVQRAVSNWQRKLFLFVFSHFWQIGRKRNFIHSSWVNRCLCHWVFLTFKMHLLIFCLRNFTRSLFLHFLRCYNSTLSLWLLNWSPDSGRTRRELQLVMVNLWRRTATATESEAK